MQNNQSTIVLADNAAFGKLSIFPADLISLTWNAFDNW